MSEKPNIFIASSVEGIDVVEAINIKLDYFATCRPWDNAFDLSSMTLPALIKKADKVEYGIFVFHKDDEVTIRDKKYSTVRDNVLFELGLFIGKLGLENCFILIPRKIEGDLRIPTDLAGVTVSTYDDEIDDMTDAVAASCARIKQTIKKHQQIKEQTQPTAQPQGSELALLKDQLSENESKVWHLQFEHEQALEEKNRLLSSVLNHFNAIAKPATEAEILKWEEGAKNNYPNGYKILKRNVFFVDQDVTIPPLHGASSISVIVKNGVKIYGVEQRSHNTIYYMDGFRKTGF